MATHVSATVHETPHETETAQITISDALRRRAQSVINDRSIDPQWRNIVRYALEINDPLLPELVRRAGAGEKIFESDEADPSREKIEASVEIICGGGGASAAALFVLMGKLEDATDPQTFAHTAKHFAFTLCGELNVFEMVDAQIAVLEAELMAGYKHVL